MKKSNIKYDLVVDEEVFKNVYKKLKSTTRHKTKLVTFDMFYSENMVDILNTLRTKSYKHDRYNIFLVHEPKDRIVMSEKLNTLEDIPTAPE